MKYLLILAISIFKLSAFDAFITPSELKMSLSDKNLIIIDVADSFTYKKSHIKDAIHADVSKFVNHESPYSLMNPVEVIQNELKELGINRDSKVVIYSHNTEEGVLNSSYAALILLYSGFENISILDGGYMAWVFENELLTSSLKSEKPDNGNFIVTYESILPNLTSLRNYKPLLQEFWKDELFAPMDRRYFRLINRANSINNEINWGLLENYSAYQTFRGIFNSENIGKESYFDLMTHFDFKTLLPALLHVEDRVSMAHGLESRVPFLDHPIVELAAKMPPNVKFKDGNLKFILRKAVRPYIPASVYNRKDKMGFPTPLSEWMRGPIKSFIMDIFSSQKAKERRYVNNQAILSQLGDEPRYSRKMWGFLNLELWHQEFEDKAAYFHALCK